jgi:hypothetical protein
MTKMGDSDVKPRAEELEKEPPFPLTEVDKWVLSQTDEEFHLHDWDDLRVIIGRVGTSLCHCTGLSVLMFNQMDKCLSFKFGKHCYVRILSILHRKRHNSRDKISFELIPFLYFRLTNSCSHSYQCP